MITRDEFDKRRRGAILSVTGSLTDEENEQCDAYSANFVRGVERGEIKNDEDALDNMDVPVNILIDLHMKETLGQPMRGTEQKLIFAVAKFFMENPDVRERVNQYVPEVLRTDLRVLKALQNDPESMEYAANQAQQERVDREKSLRDMLDTLGGNSEPNGFGGYL